MMWRAYVDAASEVARPLIDAAIGVSSGGGPPYSETQFILASSR